VEVEDEEDEDDEDVVDDVEVEDDEELDVVITRMPESVLGLPSDCVMANSPVSYFW
jgi:hypothetical protein